MLTKKLWLFAIPVAFIAIQGCGGGNGGLLSPNRTPTPANTPVPNATVTPNATAVPGTTPVPTAVPGTTPIPNATAVPGTTPVPNPTVGDNIGRYSNLASTNGQNNLDSSDFSPLPKDRDPNSGGNSIVLEQIKVNNSFRTFKFQVGNEGFVAGRSYTFTRTPNSGAGFADSSYIQGMSATNAPGGVNAQLWEVVDGTLIVDSVTGVNGGIENINFRVVNARYRPVTTGGTTDPGSQAQGAFTFNYSGNAAAFRG